MVAPKSIFSLSTRSHLRRQRKWDISDKPEKEPVTGILVMIWPYHRKACENLCYT